VQKGNTTRCASGTALKFQESVQAWTLRSDLPDQPPAPAPRRRVGARRLAAATTRHLFRPSACHLPDYARRRFRSSGWLSHHVDGRSSAPQRVPFWHPASGDPPLGLISQADLMEGKHARPLHLTQAFQAIGNPETSAQSIVCRDMGFRREGLIQTAVMGSWIVRKGRSAETGWLFAVEAG